MNHVLSVIASEARQSLFLARDDEIASSASLPRNNTISGLVSKKKRLGLFYVGFPDNQKT